MEVIMKVLNGNAVSSVISEKMCGQTNKHSNKQTNRQLDQSQDIVTGNAYVCSLKSNQNAIHHTIC